MSEKSRYEITKLYKWLSVLSVIVLILVMLSCICCAICSISATIHLSRTTSDPTNLLCSELISIFGVVISIWVGLNIYNVFEREKVKLAHQVATEALVLAEQAAENSRQFKDLTLLGIMNVLSEQIPFYTFVSYLLYQFNPENNRVLFDSIDKKTIDDFLRIEHLFSVASRLNRTQKCAECRVIADKGIESCQVYLNKYSAKYLKDPTFVKGYLYLRLGDFYFYRGYRDEEQGIPYLDKAIENHRRALIYIWGSSEKSKKISEILSAPNSNQKIGEITKEILPEDAEDDDRTALMLAYLYNVIGESYNVRSQYKDPRSTNTCTKLEACAFFDANYHIYEELKRPKHTLNHLFAKYLRNYGSALEHVGSHYNALITPDQLYETAIKLDPDDSLAYYTYCSYQLRKYRADAVVGTLHNFPDQRKIETYLKIYVAVHPANKKGYFYQYLFYLLSAYICQSINKKKSYFGLAKESFAIVKELDNSFRCDEKTQDLENKVYSCISSQPT